MQLHTLLPSHASNLWCNQFAILQAIVEKAVVSKPDCGHRYLKGLKSAKERAA